MTQQEEMLFARAIGAKIPEMLATDLVIVVLPDGGPFIVRGEDRLQEIIASGVTTALTKMEVPGPSLEFAVALQGVLAEAEARGRARN